MSEPDSLIDFPCEFPIKVFGHNDPDLIPAVLSIIQPHDASFNLQNIASKHSKTARYLSLTCTVRASSRPQLDAIYQALCEHPLVKMAL